ncbi:hypothetical protein ACWT_6827 [Actinoplanes sp. SE50]|uniref:MauE/DoxX family redox-associated membrane protein n=1 Tax=unclassified Actinoplanes TaxID=2626549 RepID=UPI00023ED31E|nr:MULTISPECIES: MauE/DoxX family redox-associated membrane protein [unclassified Actinoplanes]AEV87840.1 hypothetical protein ACPL_6958 [Actinoplanes sp. SE50/110]ATO86242.1 hypothetical protein ACWT_6827 [Actinoplanes sp. SE50]SLM03657.1 hypothetical protein ACSP50_6953 [Actinoplanes sp. SE50/110]
MPCLEIAARLLIGTVFAVAVAGKVRSGAAYREHVRSLRRMGVLPDRWVPAAAGAAAGAEAVVVVLLAVPARWTGVPGFALAGGLLAVFTAAIAVSLRGGNRAPCRCFGASSTPLGGAHVVRNLLLLGVDLAALTAMFVAARPATLAGGVVAALAGLIAGALVTSYDDIVALWRPA